MRGGGSGGGSGTNNTGSTDTRLDRGLTSGLLRGSCLGLVAHSAWDTLGVGRARNWAVGGVLGHNTVVGLGDHCDTSDYWCLNTLLLVA